MFFLHRIDVKSGMVFQAVPLFFVIFETVFRKILNLLKQKISYVIVKLT